MKRRYFVALTDWQFIAWSLLPVFGSKHSGSPIILLLYFLCNNNFRNYHAMSHYYQPQNDYEVLVITT